MSEFNIIHKYFAPLSKDGLQDDCAALDVPAGHTLLVSTDTLNAGVHFFADTPPDIIARKALRSTVSDIYASGGRPLAYQLAIGFPRPPAAEWLAAFTEGLAADQARYGVYCSGGDTTSKQGELSITITVMGVTEAPVLRSGARAGDVVAVSGTLGHGYAAFKAGKTIAPEVRSDVDLSGVHAAIDVSDGLLADAGHIAKASALDIEINADTIPHVGDLLEAVTGGDDYVLLMTAPAAVFAAMEDVTIIGRCVEGGGHVRLLDASGRDMIPQKTGWTHF